MGPRISSFPCHFAAPARVSFNRRRLGAISPDGNPIIYSVWVVHSASALGHFYPARWIPQAAHDPQATEKLDIILPLF